MKIKASDLKLGTVFLLWDPFTNINEWWMLIKIDKLSIDPDSSIQMTFLSEKGNITISAWLLPDCKFSHDYQIIC